MHLVSPRSRGPYAGDDAKVLHCAADDIPRDLFETTMTDPIRYDDDEVRAIFERATKLEATSRLPAVARDPALSGGLSLSEIQAIGAEAGIDPGRIAEAAGALTRFGTSGAPKRQMGVATTAAHTVELPRSMTDLEWDHLVVRLRDAFGGPGTVQTEGSLRTWTHAYTQVLLEPTPAGARLRMTSLDWGAKQWVDGGVVGVVSGVAGSGLFGMLAMFGDASKFLGMPMALAGGMAVFGIGSWIAGRWIANRRVPRLRQRLEALGVSAVLEVQNEPDPGRIPPPTS